MGNANLWPMPQIFYVRNLLTKHLSMLLDTPTYLDNLLNTWDPIHNN
jgi:hypothetical protein